MAEVIIFATTHFPRPTIREGSFFKARLREGEKNRLTNIKKHLVLPMSGLLANTPPIS